VRTALALGCPPLYFTDYLWPRWRCWTIDVDRCVSDERLTTLVEPSTIPLDAFRAATLRPVATLVSERPLGVHGPWSWMTTIGSRNTKRRGGLQCCPTCLANDVRPFHRLQWRFAWHTVCERHGTVLLDRCPGCRAPIEPHRLPASSPNIARCASCGADFRDANAKPHKKGSLSFQREADDVLRRGGTTLLGHEIDASEWFATAAFYVGLIRYARSTELPSLEHLLVSLGARSPTSATSDYGVGLEATTVATRHEIFSSAWQFLSADLPVLRNALWDSGTSRQGINPGRKRVPAPLAEVVDALPDRARSSTRSPASGQSGPRSRRAVHLMMARLERRLSMVGR